MLRSLSRSGSCSSSIQGRHVLRRCRGVHMHRRVGCYSGKPDVAESAYNLDDLPLPEGDYGLPIIGHTIDFVNGTNFFAKRRKKLGPVFKASAFGRPIIFVHGVENINKMFSAEPPVVEQGRIRSFAALFGDHALINLDGPEHLMLRSAIKSAFLPSAMAKYVPLMEKETDKALERWAETAGPVQFADEIHEFVYTIAADCMLGLTPEGKTKEELMKIYTTWWDGVTTPGINLPFTKFRKALKAREEILGEIKKTLSIVRQKGGKENTAIAILMNARDDNGVGLTDPQLEDIILNIMVASYDTTASAITFLLQEFKKHPQVLEKAFAEQEKVVAEYGEKMTLESIEAMKYLTAVIKETMRLRPAVAYGIRTAIRSFELNGYRIPEGWQVYPGFGASAMTDERWPEDTEYNPDRFLTPEGGKPGGQLIWGAGPHFCLGQGIAMLELRILLAKMIRRYEFSVKSDSVITTSTQPEDGMPVEFWRKSDQLV